MRIETDPQNGDWITAARQIHDAVKYKNRVSLGGQRQGKPESVYSGRK
jgi:hypothetical protein